MSIKRIGILTGGGDCPGLNAVIRAVTKSAIGIHGWEVVGFLDGFRGVVEDWNLRLTAQTVSGILTRGGTIVGTNNRADPFAYTYNPDGSSGQPRDASKTAILNLKKNEVDALVVTGGDGTLTIGKKFFEAGVPIVGVPKTIDNDLSATDVTFGFDTALAVATDAVDRLHSTAESHRRVMILEVMGRYAGWIGLRAGMAGGGDVILIPEIPYTLEKVIEAIDERAERGKEFSIIVISEGARAKGGDLTVQKVVKGSPDPLRLGGVGHLLARDIEDKTGLETRVTVLGHLQRGGIPTAHDRWLATRFGVAAVELIAQGEFGKMAALRGTSIEGVPIKDAVDKPKRVDPAGEEVRAARATGISFGN